jgi:uncharacterized protein
MDTGISTTVCQEIEGVLRNFPKITCCKLYGSRAMGNYREGSDIDLAVFGSGLGLKDQLDLVNDLEDLDYPYRFDVVIYDNIKNPALKAHIDKYGLEIAKVQESFQ